MTDHTPTALDRLSEPARPTDEDCGSDACRRAREKAWALADASYRREDETRRHADAVEWENAELRRQLAQVMRSIEGAA